MKLTLQLQLILSQEKIEILKETLERFNKACSWLASKAFEIECANKIELQRLFYQEIRSTFELSAQMTIRLISQVVEAYKRDKKICPKFRKYASMPYDERILSFKGIDKVSLLTLQGRIIVPFVMGKYQRDRFSKIKGQCDLHFREKDGKWFLLVTADIPEATPIPNTDFIGIDLGIVELATTSDGESFCGNDVKSISKKYADLRQTLQHKASAQSKDGKRPRSIRRFQKRISKRVQNFKKHSNHCIAKKIVGLAMDTRKGIALEELKGIRQRCEKRFQRKQRSTFSGWSFHQLKTMIAYKAKLNGVSVVFVDPKYTSQQCSECGHTTKDNRKSQADFECVNCHFSINADINAAINIRGRALSNYAQESETIVLQKAVELQVQSSNL